MKGKICNFTGKFHKSLLLFSNFEPHFPNICTRIAWIWQNLETPLLAPENLFNFWKSIHVRCCCCSYSVSLALVQDSAKSLRIRNESLRRSSCVQDRVRLIDRIFPRISRCLAIFPGRKCEERFFWMFAGKSISSAFSSSIFPLFLVLFQRIFVC